MSDPLPHDRVFRRIARIYVPVLLIVVSLAACRPGFNEEVTSENNDAAAATVIRFADEAFKEALYTPLMTAFTAENPEFRIEYVPLEDARDSSTGEIDLFRLASLADVMALPRAPVGGESSYFLDLSPHMDEQGLSATDYWPGALAACQGEDAIAALPLRVTPATVFVNRSLLDGAEPAPGWSWEEFAETARAAGGREAIYGYVESDGPGELFAPLISGLLPEEGGVLDAAALSEATGWYLDLVRDELVFAAAGAEAGASAALIEEARAAMWVESPAQLATRRNSLGESVTVLPFPVAGSDEARTPVTADCIALSAGTNQEQAAWSWLNFLAERPITARKWEVPGNMAIADSSGFWEGVDPDAESAFRYSLDNAWYGPFSENIEAVASALADAALSQTDSEAALVAIGELPTPTPVPTPAAVPTIASAPVPVEEGAEGTLHFFSTDGTVNMNAVREIGELFSSETGLLMQFGSFFSLAGRPQFSVTDDLLAAITSEYDCFAWTGSLPEIINGQVLPLDDLLAENHPDLLSDYAPYTLDQARRDGVLYGLPLALHPLAFYYDVDRFERRGIAPPSIGWTIDEFVEMASQMPLGEGDNAIFGYVPYPSGLAASPYALLLEAYGARPFALDADLPAVNFDDPQTIAAVNWLAELIAAGVVAQFDGTSNEGQGNANTMDAIVTSGRATIWSDTVGFAEDRFYWDAASFRMELAPPPGPSQPLPAPIMTQLYISAQSKQADACLDWFAIISGNGAVSDLVPARSSVRESAAWEERVGAEHAAIYRELVARATAGQVDFGLAQPPAYWWESALTAVFAGADAEAELSLAQERADTFLACAEESNASNFEQYNACALQADPDYPQTIH